MALDAGLVTVTVEYGKDLKDQDWFGKQDPYAIVRCGNRTFRTKTHTDGGINPVWNETFAFNVLNENSIEIEIKDEDTMGRDDVIGTATLTLAKARGQGTDRIVAPVISGRNKKQYGFVSVSLKFQSNSSAELQPADKRAYAPMAQQPYQQQPQVVYATHPGAAAPYGYATMPQAPYGYAPAPAQHGYAPVMAYAPAGQAPVAYQQQQLQPQYLQVPVQQ